MKENQKIEKQLLFKNNIKDITSISLDSDYKIENQEIVGNFLISGDYKIHELSVNREEFNFKVPFKHSFENDIDSSSIKLEIRNFEYDYNKDELIVNIEYDITGDRKDILVFDDEETLDEFLNSREVEVVDTRLNDIKKEIEKPRDLKESKQEETEKQEENNTKKATVEEVRNVEYEEAVTKQEKLETEEIISNMKTIEDNFVTYKVYTIEENETIESIVIKNKTTIDELKEYNDLSNLSINDKIIIPMYE